MKVNAKGLQEWFNFGNFQQLRKIIYVLNYFFLSVDGEQSY